MASIEVRRRTKRTRTTTTTKTSVTKTTRTRCWGLSRDSLRRSYVCTCVGGIQILAYVCMKPKEMYIPYILPLASSAEPCQRTKPVSFTVTNREEWPLWRKHQSVLLLRQHQSNKQQIPLFATGSSIHTPLSEIYVKEIASVTLLISVCSKECLRRGPRATLRCYHKSRKTEQ
jgi:hypothetical protein